MAARLVAVLAAMAVVVAACSGGSGGSTSTAETATSTVGATTPGATVTKPAAPSATRAATPAPVARSTATPSPTARAGDDVIHRYTDVPAPPTADLYELASRFKFGGQPIAHVPRNVTSYTAGRVDTFTVLDLDARRPFTITATLRRVTEHTYLYIEQGVTVIDADLDRTATEIEQHIIPAEHRLANPNWDPGAGVDQRVSILIGHVPGVAGYFNYTDLLPKTIQPYSNERPMVYMNVDAVQPGTVRFYATLTHEFQHAAQSQADPYEESWLQEGSSEYLAEAAGYPVAEYPSYFDRPATQLTAWPDDPGSNAAHYGAANLFVRYLSLRYGQDAVVQLITSPLRGIAGVEDFVRRQGTAGGFDAVIADWVAANYTGEVPNAKGSLLTLAITGTPSLVRTISRSGDYDGAVAQYGADYIRVAAQQTAVKISFSGPVLTPLLPTTVPSGQHLWWGQRGDAVDSRLTRRFDLTGLSMASLNFKMWYDTERGFDFAYVEASRDGQHWDVLRGAHATAVDPLSQAYGPGYSGLSGGGRQPAWVDEQVDLSAYAGRPVFVRFEYITDQSTSNDGFAIDDIAVPEAKFFDDVETPGDWQAEGFYRTANVVEQRFAVRLLTKDASGKWAVQEMALDASNRGSLSLPAGQEAVVAVAGLAPVTTVSASFHLAVQS